jgi:hypothetical protein
MKQMISSRVEGLSWVGGIGGLLYSVMTSAPLKVLIICFAYLVVQILYTVITWPSEKEELSQGAKEDISRIILIHRIAAISLILIPLSLAACFQALEKVPDAMTESCKEILASPAFQSTNKLTHVNLDTGNQGETYFSLKLDKKLMIVESKPVYKILLKPLNYWIPGASAIFLALLVVCFIALYLIEIILLSKNKPNTA